jgi:ribosomal-protein-serine acetyltransferase
MQPSAGDRPSAAGAGCGCGRPTRAFLGARAWPSLVGDGGLEIGYWVHGDWTGRGIATDAAVALTDAALGLPGIDWVEIYHDAANVASGRIPA